MTRTSVDICAGSTGRGKVRYTEHEFCTLRSGKVRVSDEMGASVRRATT